MTTSSCEPGTLAEKLKTEMEQTHGPLLGGLRLANALGHASVAGLRQARYRGQVAVTLFTLPHRRGFYALTRDVAHWLAQARITSSAEYNKEGKTRTTLNLATQKRKSPRRTPRA